MFDDLDLDALNAGDVAETLEAIIKADLDYDNVDYTHSTRAVWNLRMSNYHRKMLDSLVSKH